MKKKVYVVTNSHMDPIWLWRLREGRSTWLNTCRTVVRMMEKYPFLTFTRSSSVCYQWIEDCDKALFRKIVKLVDAGRWELVGGWVEQSDTIITPGESLLRQAEHGKKYFLDKFGRDIRIAYSVDSFGQNAGLAQILKKSGFDYYAYMRPMIHEKVMPDSFRWQCTGGAGDVVTFRIRNAYCTPPQLDDARFADWFERGTKTDASSLPVFFYGVGDHGGGIYEKQLKQLLSLQDKYDLEFCTLEHYFHQLEKLDLPVWQGEMTHHSPGCYAATGDVKLWMADCEKNLKKAEKINLQLSTTDQKNESKKLYGAWEKLLFNYFHDVYSGTCIGAAYQHEIRDICGSVNDVAVESLERSLCRLGSAIPSRSFMTEGGVLLWNPNAFAARCSSSFMTNMNPNYVESPFNCLKTADGREIPLQGIRADAACGDLKRVVVLDDLGPSEARVYAYARTAKKYPDVGFKTQKAFLKKFSFAVLADTGDTWGHDVKRLGETLGYAEKTATVELENGPVVSILRVCYQWKDSAIQLDLYQYAGIAPLYAKVRLDWRETDDTLKAVLKTPKKITATVSGQASAILRRAVDDCEQPFIDWVAAEEEENAKTGFLAHSLHGYDVLKNELRLTVLRPVIYAEHVPNPPHGDEGYADLGRMERTFWCFHGAGDEAACARLAEERLITAEHVEVTAADGNAKFAFDRWEVTPAAVAAQSERILSDGSVEFHLLNRADETVTATIRCNGKVLKKLRLNAGELKAVQLQ